MEQKEGIIDHLTISMDNKLTQLSNNYRHEPFICRVYNHLRRQNQRAYEPELLAIGPYHRGKPTLKVMEEHKLRYLQLLLQRREQSSVHIYVTSIRGLEQRARGCYADDIGLHEGDQFLEMLILDGCFIVELCRKFENRSMVDRYDVLFKMDYLHHWMWRDMLLFENQIPFFIVDHLFKMTASGHEKKSMVDLLLIYYSTIRRYYHYHSKALGNNKWLQDAKLGIESGNIKHILGLIHYLTTRSFNQKLCSKQNNNNNNNNVDDRKVKWEFMHSTTELREVGIRFRAKYDSSMFDITFANGVLYIPLITIDDKTECLFRNIIAYEQSLGNNNLKIATDYLTFFYCIIKSSKDVSLLRRYGIINNMLGDDEAVSRSFSNTSLCVFVSQDRFCYKDVFNEVNAHCRRKRNIWLVKLMRTHFNSPWSIMSVVAALFLLMLTLTQTVIALVPYLKQHHHHHFRKLLAT